MPPTVRRSVGHSHVLPPELRTPAGAAAVAGRLLEKAAERMRHQGFQARGLRCMCAGEDRQTWAAKRRLTPCADTWTLMAALRSLWEHPFPMSVKLGSCCTTCCRTASVTPSLFGEDTAAAAGGAGCGRDQSALRARDAVHGVGRAGEPDGGRQDRVREDRGDGLEVPPILGSGIGKAGPLVPCPPWGGGFLGTYPYAVPRA